MKRLFSIMLALCLATALLAGCGGGTSSSAPASTPASAGSAPAEDSQPGSQPAATGDVTKIIWQQIGTQPGNLVEGLAAINEYTREKIGVELDLRFFDWGEWENGITNMLNTGEEYDIMFIQTRFFRGHAMSGKFLDISGMLDSTPGLTDLIPEKVWTGVTMQGAIYGVPTYKDSASTQYIAFDKALVDKYDIDLDSLKSLQDLDPVLRQIKEGEEAESGETMYPLPLTSEGYSAIRAPYDNYVRYDDTSAKVHNTWEREEVVRDLALLHKWWEDGIINPDASTKGDPDKYRPCFIYQGFAGDTVALSADRGYDIVSTPYTETIFSTESIQGSVNAISANCKNPEKALQFLELANTDHTLRDMLAYGVPDVDFKDNGDGTVTKLTDTWTAPAYSQATFFTMSPVAPNTPDQWTQVQAQNDNAVAHVLLGFALQDKIEKDGEVLLDIQNEVVNIEAALTKYYPELLTGAYQGTTEDYLKKVNDEIYAAGLQTVLDETQAQVDAFMAGEEYTPAAK